MTAHNVLNVMFCDIYIYRLKSSGYHGYKRGWVTEEVGLQKRLAYHRCRNGTLVNE